MRTLVKTITWRVIGSSATFIIAYIITGQIAASSSIAITQMIVNTVLYYIHEVFWNRVSWRK